MGYTPAEGEMEFCKLTDLYAKILTWTTVSSNNADMEVMQDPKYQKNIGFFADFKASLGAWEFMESIIDYSFMLWAAVREERNGRNTKVSLVDTTITTNAFVNYTLSKCLS